MPQSIHHCWRQYSQDPSLIEAKITDPEKGPYIFFRWTKSVLQARMADIIPHTKIPQVHLHGSAHIDNYAKTHQGAGMVDFDRAYIGPYCWDIICLITSLSLRNPKYFQCFLPKEIPNTFYQGYISALENPDVDYQHYPPLETINIKDWEKNTNAYLKAEKKWAGQIMQDAIANDDPKALALFQQYCQSLDEDLNNGYTIHTIAQSQGTFGRDRYLYILQPKQRSVDSIIIDIKKTRDYHPSTWPHSQWYHNPFDHHGKRMIAAAKIYAPTCVIKEGYATLDGQQYWGRQIPTLNRKPKKIMNKNQLIEFSLAAGSQLGKGHAIALQQNTKEELAIHFRQHYFQWVGLCHLLQQELMSAWQHFRKELINET